MQQKESENLEIIQRYKQPKICTLTFNKQILSEIFSHQSKFSHFAQNMHPELYTMLYFDTLVNCRSLTVYQQIWSFLRFFLALLKIENFRWIIAIARQMILQQVSTTPSILHMVILIKNVAKWEGALKRKSPYTRKNRIPLH